MATGVFAFGVTNARAYQLSPMAQDFSPTGRGASQDFSIINNDDRQMAVMVSVVNWEIDYDGVEINNPAKEFAVFPTEIIVPPRSTRTVRVRWIGDPAPSAELAYRLIVEEVLLKSRERVPGSAIFMALRYVASLYVVPPNVKLNVHVLSARQVKDSKGESLLEIIARNCGSRHAILDEQTLGAMAESITKTLDPVSLTDMTDKIVLAQHQRRFLVPWPENSPPDPVEVGSHSPPNNEVTCG